MTPKEQRYLFLTIYFTVQGIFLLGAMLLCLLRSSKYKKIEEAKANPDSSEYDKWDLGLLLLFSMKLLNSAFLVINWANFIDPEGA